MKLQEWISFQHLPCTTSLLDHMEYELPALCASIYNHAQVLLSISRFYTFQQSRTVKPLWTLWIQRLEKCFLNLKHGIQETLLKKLENQICKGNCMPLLDMEFHRALCLDHFYSP